MQEEQAAVGINSGAGSQKAGMVSGHGEATLGAQAGSGRGRVQQNCTGVGARPMRMPAGVNRGGASPHLEGFCGTATVPPSIGMAAFSHLWAAAGALAILQPRLVPVVHAAQRTPHSRVALEACTGGPGFGWWEGGGAASVAGLELGQHGTHAQQAGSTICAASASLD